MLVENGVRIFLGEVEKELSQKQLGERFGVFDKDFLSPPDSNQLALLSHSPARAR